jgi:hypothetical protein
MDAVDGKRRQVGFFNFLLKWKRKRIYPARKRKRKYTKQKRKKAKS